MKLWRMGKLLCSLGGKGRSQLYTKWALSKWTIQLYENEVIQQFGRKRKSSENIILLCNNKKSKVEEKLKVANNKQKEITNEYQNLKKSCIILSKALKDCGNSSRPSQVRPKNH